MMDNIQTNSIIIIIWKMLTSVLGALVKEVIYSMSILELV